MTMKNSDLFVTHKQFSTAAANGSKHQTHRKSKGTVNNRATGELILNSDLKRIDFEDKRQIGTVSGVRRFSNVPPTRAAAELLQAKVIDGKSQKMS